MCGIWALTMAVAVIALPEAVSAQTVGDFRLPPAGTPTPRIQGPTDSEHPVLRPTTPVRSTTPAPSPSASAPAPSPIPDATRAAPASVVARRPAVIASPAPQAAALPEPSPSAKPTPSTTVESPPANPLPTTPPVIAASSAVEPALPHAAEQSLPLSWPWLLAIASALLALGAWWLHGRPAKLADDAWEEADWLKGDAASPDAEIAPEPEHPADSVVEPNPPPPPVPHAPPVEAPVRPAFGREILTLSLDPVRMSATLTSTSLSYRLTVTNKCAQVLGPVAIAGSMISAHASLPTEVQLGTDGQLLEVLHEISTLAPGESAVVTGELRLPLPQITPIKSGESLLFIPLARFRAEAGDASTMAAYAIGETSVATSGGLLPLRIDMGPRIWNSISRHQIELAAV